MMNSIHRALLLAGVWVFSLTGLPPSACLAEEGDAKWLEPAIAAYTRGMESTQRDERLRLFSDSERFFTAACRGGVGVAGVGVTIRRAVFAAVRVPNRYPLSQAWSANGL